MSLVVNHNISAMNTLRNLQKTSFGLSKSLQKLSSGYKINVAADDPAGLIISEKLRAQIVGLDRCVRNSQEASNIVGIAEGALIEANSILKSIRQLALHAANTGATTPEQVTADQQEVNSAVRSIQRIAETTRFADRALLDGTVGNLNDFNPLEFKNFELSRMTLDTANNAVWMRASVDVVTAYAERAEVETIDITDGAGDLNLATTFTITGNRGTVTYTTTLARSLADTISDINDLTSTTGVRAAVNTAGDGLAFQSEFYGANEFVSIVDEGGLDQLLGAISGDTDTGVDLDADITVQMYSSPFGDTGTTVGAADGSFDNVTADGVTIKFNDYLHSMGDGATDLGDRTIFQIDVQSAVNDGASLVGNVFDIGGGSMVFHLTEGTDPAKDQETFSFDSLLPSIVGAYDDGTTTYHLEDISESGTYDASLATDPLLALEIIDATIDDVSAQRALLGAFQKNTLETNINSLRVAIENITATESSVRDANIAQETTEFTKNQILLQAGTAMLAQANVASQNVLQLLG